MKLDVLYEDEDIVAINKPAGLLVHRSKIDVYAKEFAIQKLRDQIGKPVFLVHRLDRPTSGVLLFALNANSARTLSEQFSNRKVKKFYRAIVRGHVARHECWDEPLIEKQDRASDKLASSNKPAQPAVTVFQHVRNWEVPFSAGKYPTSRYSEVNIEPITGRKHQIRRHFNHMAHPLIGDTTYGDRRHNKLFREQFGISRLLLTSKKLQFVHPVTNQQIEIESPLPSEFNKAVEQLNRYSICKH